MNNDEIKRTVERARAAGLVSFGKTPQPIKLTGDLGTVGPVSMALMEVDPATAQAWLAHNRGNRKLKEQSVVSYARDMRAGRWLLTHQGIAFNDKKELIDGQHRLHAIVKCGKAVRMFVTLGWPSKQSADNTMDAVDRGCLRSIADVLGLQHGVDQPKLVASIAGHIARIALQSAAKKGLKLTTAQTLDVLALYKPGIQWMIENRIQQHGLRSVIVQACLAMAWMSPSHRPMVEMFRASFVSGAGLAEDSPILHLRNHLLGNGGSIFQKDIAAAAQVVAHHLLAHCNRDPVTKVTGSEVAANWLLSLHPEGVKRIQTIMG